MRLLPDVIAGMAKLWDRDWDFYPSALRKRVRQEKETPPVDTPAQSALTV
jgi:hypothetical protein